MKNKFSKFINLQGKYLTSLLFVLLFAVGQMWADTWVRLDSVDFTNTTNFPAQTITGANSAVTTATINGVFFRAKAKKSIKINNTTAGIDFDGQNGDASSHHVGIPVTGVNGSLKVIIYHDYNTTSASFKIGISHAENNDPSESQTWDLTVGNTGATKNKNDFIMTKTGLTGTDYIVWALEAGTSYKVIKKIAIYTLAPSDVAPAITAPTTDQSASYTVGDVISALEVTATGSPAPTYQWYYNNSASTEGATSLGSGAQTASYTPSNAAASDLYYYCVATNSEGNAQSPYFHITVSAAVATAPSFTSPASEPVAAEYHVGDVISALEVEATGYPAPTLQWYSNDSKSTTGATLISGAESASYTPSNAAESDLYYYCVASNSEGDAQSEYFHVTVAAAVAPTPCATLTPATSGDSPTAVGQEALLQAGSTGGKIVFVSYKTGNNNTIDQSFTYTSRGLQLNKGGDDKIRVELNHLIQEGTIITVNMDWTRSDDKASGLILRTGDDATTVKTMTMVNPSGAFSDYYEVQSTDTKLIGSNSFILARSNSVGLKSVTVSNCGAELHALTSAVSVEGKGTVTLSKSLIAEGGTATATYSDIDAAYEFDEWVINGTGAWLSSNSANPTTITMGSTDAVVTLKLKAAPVKHTVTFDSKGGSTVENQLVVEGGHASVPVAPTKFKYTFGGWSEIDGGSTPANLSEIAINADKTFYAIWNAKVCPTNGEIASVVYDPAKKPGSETSVPANSRIDMTTYATVTNAVAYLGNTGGSQNAKITTSKFKLGGSQAYAKLELECALEEGDTIIIDNSTKIKLSLDSAKTAAITTSLASGTHEWLVPEDGDGLTTIFVWQDGSNVEFTYVKVKRPVMYTVTFNSNGGSSVAAASVVLGAKVTEPAEPTRTGYRFVKWQKAGVDYDFDATVTGSFTLDAVWQKTWNVTFDADNGETPVVVAVDANTAVAQPANPTKAGNDFVEWQLSGSAYDFATLVNGDITLTATWTPKDDDATLQYLEVDGVEVPVPADGIYRMVADYGHNPVVTAATTSSSGASRDIYNVPTHSDDEGGYDYVQVVVTAHDGVTVKYYQIRYTHAPKLGVEIIKATHNGTASGATVTGYIGGTVDKLTQNGGKLGSDDPHHYFGIQLASGKFQAGDMLVIKASALNGGNAATLYSDKGETEIITSGSFDAASKMYIYTLTAETEKIYLYRQTSACNPNVEYMAVYRYMAPFIEEFKFGDDVATINEGAKTISIDVPYGTDVTALTPTVKYWGNGGGAITPEGAQDFTSAVNYTVSSAYAEDATGDYAPVTYAVTVNVAAPSENAYLASLSVAGYALDFDKEVTSYDIVLDYGTTALPAISYEVEDTGLAEAVKAEGGVNGATTITVTPQAGAGYEKVYTINFSVSTTPKFVIFDGSTMSSIAESGSDNGTGFAWTITGQNTLNASNATGTFEAKAYTKEVNLFTSATKGEGEGDTRYMTITIPENYVAKFRLVGTSNSNSGERSLFISKTKTGVLDQSIAYATSETYNTLAGMTSAFQLPGTYYLCATKSIRLYELSIQLYPIDKQRTLTPGMLATVCLPNSGVMLGASIFEVAYYDVDSKKIFFDEVEGGVMEAGMPYIVLANEGSTQFAVKYTGSENAAAQTHHGLAGWLGAEKSLAENEYFIYDNKYYYVNAADAASGRVRITAEHAYIPNIADVPGYGGTPYPAPAPGRRRVALDAQGTQVATGIEGVEATEITVQKVLINGQMYILRGEQMYDATGRLVK